MRLCVSGARFGVRLTLRIRDWGALARAMTYTLPQEHRFTHVQGSRYADLHHKNWTLQHCRNIMPLPTSSVLAIGPIMVFTFFFRDLHYVYHVASTPTSRALTVPTDREPVLLQRPPPSL